MIQYFNVHDIKRSNSGLPRFITIRHINPLALNIVCHSIYKDIPILILIYNFKITAFYHLKVLQKMICIIWLHLIRRIISLFCLIITENISFVDSYKYEVLSNFAKYEINLCWIVCIFSYYLCNNCMRVCENLRTQVTMRPCSTFVNW